MDDITLKPQKEKEDGILGHHKQLEEFKLQLEYVYAKYEGYYLK